MLNSGFQVRFCGLLVCVCWPASDLLASDPIQPTGEVQKVEGGFAFTEGPAVADDGTLYFTDIPNETIHRLPPGGKVEVFVKPSGHANGLMIAADGRLVACQMDGQVVAYDRETKAITVLADQFNGQRFNAPNDLAIDADGGIYFTDPLFRAPDPLPQGIQAVYYIAPDRSVTRVTEGLPAPNGIGISADGKTLYVIPSRSAEMLAYPIQGPGQLGANSVFCKLKQPEGRSDSGGDGMALDVEGNLYITSDLGIQIFSSAGQYRGLVTFPEQPANVAFGGQERKTMYVTARTGLYRVTMPISGRP